MTGPRLTFQRLLALAQAARTWGQAERQRRAATLARLTNTQSAARSALADSEAAAEDATEAAANGLLAALEQVWPQDGDSGELD